LVYSEEYLSRFSRPTFIIALPKITLVVPMILRFDLLEIARFSRTSEGLTMGWLALKLVAISIEIAIVVSLFTVRTHRK